MGGGEGGHGGGGVGVGRGGGGGGDGGEIPATRENSQIQTITEGQPGYHEA